MDLRKIAKKYISEGFSVIPVTLNKEPALYSWIEFQERQMTDEEIEKHFLNADGIAVLCGGPWRLFCLDVDLKYDLTGDIFERFKKEVPKEILKKLYVQKTKNNGYHLVAKVPSTRLFGNQKFASRYTTPEEKHGTYLDYFYDPITRPNALKIASNDISRVIFESRSGTPESAGGYFLVPPSHGYEKVYGKIGEITEDEYDILTDTARSFEEVVKEKTLYKRVQSGSWEITPFDMFNQEYDALGLLLKYGWTIRGKHTGRYVRLKRPGKAASKDSAIFDTSTKVFNVFSTSTSFNVGVGYPPASLFIELECNGDEKEGYDRIVYMGYGKKQEKK